ncbi:MAG: ribonuclease J [Clostridia bacterium]|nr:ribonuclease J [Clostridia bacterium]
MAKQKEEQTREKKRNVSRGQNQPAKRRENARPHAKSENGRKTERPQKQNKRRDDRAASFRSGKAAGDKRERASVSERENDSRRRTRTERPTPKRERVESRFDGTLRIIPLGGLGEIGKNMTAIELGEDIVVIDCGLAFPDEDMPGVDLVIPDVSYLVKNQARLRGILLTHGHEDHIGAIPYVLQQLRTPIYGTRLTVGIVKNKLEETSLPYTPELHTVEAGDTVALGAIKAEFIHVNHSIADACCIALHTPAGVVFHTGDFKLDVSPIDGKMIDLVRIGQLGEEGVKLLLCESTNAERPGFTPSERTVGLSLDRLFMEHRDKRLIIATFSSNVHRVQQIINAAAKYGRRVAVVGRSMVNVIGAAVDLGYMNLPEGVLIDVADAKRYKPEQLTIITTGSQGEPMSALYRMAFSEHNQIKLTPSDLVILSASAIPGNEKLVGKIINALVRAGIHVVNDAVADVHVSGHACREELKMMIGLTKPEYFMPVHGEERHLYANKALAEFMGIPSDHIFVSTELGQVLEIDRKGARFTSSVPAGKVLVDGSGVGDVGSVVLRDRKTLAQSGLIAVVATVDPAVREIVSGPEIVSRGFVYVRDNEELLDQAKKIAYDAINRALDEYGMDWAAMKTAAKEKLAKFLYEATGRSPVILPVILSL